MACSSTASDAMDKKRLRLDSAHQRGLETPFHDVLIVVGTWFTGGRNKFGAELLPAEFETTWLVAQEPRDPWTNGCYSRIQRIK